MYAVDVALTPPILMINDYCGCLPPLQRFFLPDNFADFLFLFAFRFLSAWIERFQSLDIVGPGLNFKLFSQ